MAISPDQLLVHDAFVRGVARAILGDEAEVDDVVQETWIRALDTGPDRVGALRGWLRVVARNLSLRSIRSRMRRRSREAERAPKEALDPTDRLVACEEIRIRLFRAVMALAEEYRSPLVLRYYEGLPPRTVAVRLGLPVETVKTRLKRGVALLRRRLESDHSGGREQWLGILAILADPRRQGPADGLASLGRAVGIVLGGFLALVALLPSDAPVPEESRHPLVADAAIDEVTVPVPVMSVAESAPHDAPCSVEGPHGLLGPGPDRFEAVPRAAAALDPIAVPPARHRSGDVGPVPEPGRLTTLSIVVSDGRRLRSAGSTRVGEEPENEDEVELVVEGDLPAEGKLDLTFPGLPGLRLSVRVSEEAGTHRALLRLPWGEYEVGGADPEYLIEPTRFRVGPGEPDVVTLRVCRPVARFRLHPNEDRRHVRNLEDGKLVLRAVSVVDAGRTRVDAGVDGDGPVTLRGIRPGDYEVFYRWPAHGRHGPPIHLGTVELTAGISDHHFLVPSEPR